MRLSDHLCAAAGGITDFGGFATTMSHVIKEAERMEISDEVALACGDLLGSRPSALAAALPLCRLPYETLWLEWHGGLGPNAHKPRDGAPIPERQGVLIESMKGQRGFMTLAWVHALFEGEPVDHGVNISPLAMYFDWRPDGDVHDTVRMAHQVFLEEMPRSARLYVEPYIMAMEKKWLRISSVDVASHFLTGSSKWAKLAANPREIEAIRELDRHLAPGLSPHGAMLVALILRKSPDKDTLRHFMMSWEADIQGEATWIECFLAMLNSKNPVIEHEAADLTKLNRARVRRGRPEFLTYKKTRLVMSRSQQRIADARGVDRETARQHLVRGHFKIRRTGVYWWAPFLRGDPTRGPIKRDTYEVV
jgi:hypothetical protein